jgi:uncharacterized membrane protein YidH (DUF202 family)
LELKVASSGVVFKSPAASVVLYLDVPVGSIAHRRLIGVTSLSEASRSSFEPLGAVVMKSDVRSQEVSGPSRRTQFAQERTLLAWWRIGLASAAVALAVGGLVPRLGHFPKARFFALGVEYGLLALGFVIGGAIRGHRSRRALMSGGFSVLLTFRWSSC